MTDKERTIATAALQAYARQGVRRTTMTDVAKEAGVTRQTVYNTFANTDAVLAAAIQAYVDILWADITTDWQRCNTLAEKLDVMLHRFVVDSWEFLNSSDAAAELQGGYNAAGKAAIERARLGFRKDIADLFTPHEDALRRAGTDPLTVADFIGAATEGIKYNNKTRDALMRALATLKASLLAVAGVK
ncbi:TetR/AcrR family transcriptional regulator [Thalassobius sp. Cn5-15]|nr:TetR/AcrR family transcriptional regulator [Thalassobius sp. Cn5-15]